MISKEEFGLWKRQEVTKAMYAALENMRNNIDEEILSIDYLNPSAQIILSNFAGFKEGLDIVLNLTAEELDD